MLGFGKKIKKLVTHNGTFHTDDVFACATLCLLLEKKGEKFEIIRTRDEEAIKNADYVFDVGGIYDEARNRFDHHQPGGAGKRENGIEYASFGLVWKKFGKEICTNPEVVLFLDKKLVSPIDAGDNGFDLIENKHEISPYLIQKAFFSMTRTWKESTEKNNEYFLKAVLMAKEILVREITWAEDSMDADNLVISAYQSAQNKRIIILDKDYPFEKILSKFPEPMFVVSRRMTDGLWKAQAIREDQNTFKNRKDFPKSWSGLRDGDLQKASGISDAIFCHRALFMAIAKSKEGAVKLAQIALESKE